MSRPKGLPKTGGRTKGSLNWTNQFQIKKVEELCERYKFDPLESLIKLAVDPGLATELRIGILKELAQYLYPKKRSIEVMTEVDLMEGPQVQIYLPRKDDADN